MDKLEEIRQKELEVQKKQLFAQRVTAAASVASAVAAHKQAVATGEIQRQIAADSERDATHQRRIVTLQSEMAHDQRLTNFRNTVLTTLPLLKDEKDKEQYLTEQLLCKLKEEINEREFIEMLTPIGVISFVANPILENYVQNVAGRDLKDFLSTGKDLMERSERWIEKCRAREKEINDLKEARSKVKITSTDFLKFLGWFFAIFLIINAVSDFLGVSPPNPQHHIYNSDAEEATAQQQYDGFGQNVAIASCVIGAILHFGLKWRKIKRLKIKIQLLPSPDNDPALKREKEEVGGKMILQEEKWETFRPQIVTYLMGIQNFKNLIAGDPRMELLKNATIILEPAVNDLQCFLPPSSRLSASHYAEKFIGETDIQKFRDGQRAIEMDLKNLLTPLYAKQTVVIRSQKPPKM